MDGEERQGVAGEAVKVGQGLAWRVVAVKAG